MKINYSEFKQRLLRGGYHCTKIQSEGLYTRYLSDTAPDWVVECLQPAKPQVVKPKVEHRAMRIASKKLVLAALTTKPMMLDELGSKLGKQKAWLHRVLQDLVDDGVVLLEKHPVRVKSGRSEITPLKNHYSRIKKPAKTAQNAKNGGSKPEKVKVYRKDCVGCLYANEAVCCGGVR